MKAKQISSVVISVIVGITFLVSGFSKLPTLEQFGWSIVETTFLNWTFAEWTARILIGLELFLGVLFLFYSYIKKIAIPAATILLVIFTSYLFAIMNMYGDSGNCGCFGEVIPMTPLQSIYKNIIILALLAVLYKLHTTFSFRYQRLVFILLVIASLIVPFLVLPPESIYIYEKEKDIMEPIPLSMLYQSPINEAPKVELRKGKHILVFMSMTCIYCKKAARRLRIMKEKHPSLPIHIILNGDTAINLKPFLTETRANNIPYTIFNGAQGFSTLNRGTNLPSIKWVSDTTLIRESNYVTLNEKEILAWLNEK